MGQPNRFAPFVVLFAIFSVLQPALVALDCRQTPASVAKRFIQEYYYLDPSMQQWLCAQSGGDPWVSHYLQSKSDEAARRGFDVTYLRRMFTHLHVETIAAAADSATVQVKGVTRAGIYPAFMVVAKMFGIGQDYPVDVIVYLIKEKGRWKVCSPPPSATWTRKPSATPSAIGTTPS
ncbi:MAG: hypothetical protein WAU91_05345 [Desulfatitalea sp.]